MACKSCLSAVKCVVEILQFIRQKFISIGNDMISSAIWNKKASVNFFQRLTKFHEPVGRVHFVFYEKINKCLFIPNCTRKIM